MSRRSAARRASNARAYAFTPPRSPQHPPRAAPGTTDRLGSALARLDDMRAEAAELLGFDSIEALEAHQEQQRIESMRLPENAGADRSHSYLITQMLRERDGNECYLCRRDMTGLSAVVEHIIPLSRGGSNEPSNVALACADCNIRKGNMYVSIDVPSGATRYHR